MNDGDSGRHMLAAYRASVQPSARDRGRVAQAIAAAQRRASTRAIGARITIAALAAAVVLAFAITWLHESSRTVVGERVPQDAAVDRAVDRDAPAPTTARAAPTSAAPLPVAPAVAPAAPPGEVVTTPPRARGRERAPTPVVSAVDGVREEAELVDRARRALDDGDHDRVLAFTREHGRRFATGTLVIEARALRILALCGADRREQGRGEALVFLREHEHAPYRDRIRTSCGIEAPQ